MSETIKAQWFTVGNGKRLHWFFNEDYALCGVGPRDRFVEPRQEDEKCQRCMKELEKCQKARA